MASLSDLLDQAAVNQGLFGARRRHDVHTGTDLYCPEGTLVRAIEEGEIVWMDSFTGPQAGSPWWETTMAVMVQSDSGGHVVLYGEIAPIQGVRVGKKVSQGAPLGNVMRVLKKDKGKPMSMLHLEVYDPGVTSPAEVWNLADPNPPPGLQDSTKWLQDHMVPNHGGWWNLDTVCRAHNLKSGDLYVVADSSTVLTSLIVSDGTGLNTDDEIVLFTMPHPSSKDRNFGFFSRHSRCLGNETYGAVYPLAGGANMVVEYFLD